MKLRIFASLERSWSVMRVRCLASLLGFVLPGREIKIFLTYRYVWKPIFSTIKRSSLWNNTFSLISIEWHGIGKVRCSVFLLIPVLFLYFHVFPVFSESKTKLGEYPTRHFSEKFSVVRRQHCIERRFHVRFLRVLEELTLDNIQGFIVR